MNLNVQTKTATTSATKLAVAFAFLGAAALAAAAASMPTTKLASTGGYGYENYPASPLINDQPDIKRFDMQIAPDKAVYVTNSFSYQNLSFDPTWTNNVFNKTGSGTQATLQITPSLYQGTSTVSYGFGVVYNQFPAPKFNGEINPFQLEVINKGVLIWSNKPRVSLVLDPALSKVGSMTFFALTKNEDGLHMIPEVGADDITFITMKNVTSTSTPTPTTTPTTVGAAVSIEKAYDATTLDKILTPSVTPVQIGKWKLTAKNAPVTINKLTFQLLDEKGKLVTDSKDFGPISLYNAANMVEPIAISTYQPGIGKGIVQFTVGNKVVIQKDSALYLVMKASVTGSGIMKPNAIRTWSMRVTAPSSVTFTDGNSGQVLPNSQMYLSSTTAPVAPGSVQSFNYNLLHNTAPVINAINNSFELAISQNAPVFKFNITNPGDRELRIASTTIKLFASGLTGNGKTATGSISNFKLYEANASGNLGSPLAINTTCTLVGGLNIPTLNGCAINAATSPILISFNNTNDVNSVLDNFTISAGGSRTFIVTADTTSMFNGKTMGSVSVVGSLDGDSGFNRYTMLWNNGPLMYYYAPVGGLKEIGPFAQSDSYDVQGNYLTKSI